MRLTLRELRSIIQEEVDRNNRWSAGIFGGGIGNTSHVNRNPPTLGGPADEDEFESTVPEEDDEEFSQAGARVFNNTGGSGSGHENASG